MNMYKYLFLIVITLMGLTSCESENNDINSNHASNITTVDIQKDTWTYINIESGKVVGTSTLGDLTADEEWKKREDWDIALCNDLLRTNSGYSGNGEGGLKVVKTSFDFIDEAPVDGYDTDNEMIEVY